MVVPVHKGRFQPLHVVTLFKKISVKSRNRSQSQENQNKITRASKKQVIKDHCGKKILCFLPRVQ